MESWPSVIPSIQNIRHVTQIREFRVIRVVSGVHQLDFNQRLASCWGSGWAFRDFGVWFTVFCGVGGAGVPCCQCRAPYLYVDTFSSTKLRGDGSTWSRNPFCVLPNAFDDISLPLPAQT